MAALARHNVPGVWPFLDAKKAEKLLREKDLVWVSTCGQAKITSFTAQDYFETIFSAVPLDPVYWAGQEFAQWWQEFAGKNKEKL